MRNKAFISCGTRNKSDLPPALSYPLLYKFEMLSKISNVSLKNNALSKIS